MKSVRLLEVFIKVDKEKGDVIIRLSFHKFPLHSSGAVTSLFRKDLCFKVSTGSLS